MSLSAKLWTEYVGILASNVLVAWLDHVLDIPHPCKFMLWIKVFKITEEE
jgi:hypothetical protein